MRNIWRKGLRQLLALGVAFSLTIGTVFATAYDVESLKEEVSTHLVNWEPQFEVEYVGNMNDEAIDKLKSSVNEALQSIPYVSQNMNRYEVEMLYTAKRVTMNFNITYLTSLEKENLLNEKLADALSNMGLKGLSDYQKVKRIADWISDHYSYDDSLSIHSASEMSERGIGVCQAYASMFYKMATAAGLEVVYQEGDLNGGAHLWNLVNIAGKWYHVDVTNYDANKRSMLLMVGTEELKPLVFDFDPPRVSIETNSSQIDRSYDNGLFDASLIKQRLQLTAYKSQGFTADYNRNKTLEVLYKQLDDASALALNKPTKENYNALLQLISKGQVMGLDTSHYSRTADNISMAQYDQAKALIQQAATQIKVLKGSKFTEKSALAVLKLVEDTRVKVDKLNVLDSHSAYLNGQVSVLGKEAANYLMQSYYNSYKKTKSSAWLTKIKAINGKYGITMTIK